MIIRQSAKENGSKIFFHPAFRGEILYKDEEDKFLCENIFGTRSQSNPLRLNVALLDEKISGIGTFCFVIW